MNIIKATTIFIFTVVVFSCSTAPDFQRDNENDPNSSNYSPNPPSGVNFEVNELGDVTINWEDDTTHESGYRIYKSIGKSKDSLLIAELKPNTTQYKDTSRVLAYPTKYYVSSYANDSESKPITIPIDFGRVTRFDAVAINNYSEIRLSWDSNIFFIDGYILSKTVDNDPEPIFIKEISPDTKNLVLDSPEDGFNQYYKITPYLIHNSDTTTLDNVPIRKISFSPKNIQLKLIASDSLQVKWTDVTTFGDQFSILTHNEEFFTDKGSTTFYLNKKFKWVELVEIKVRGKKGSIYSDTESKFIRMELPRINIDDINQTSENEVAIKISDPSMVNREKIVYRRSENTLPEAIGIIPKKGSVFYDQLEEESRIYTYYVKGDLSPISNLVSIKNSYDIDLLNKVDVDNFNPEQIAHNPELNLIAYITFINDRKLKLYNYKQGQITQTLNVNFGIRNLTISGDGNKVAGLSSDYSKIYIVDFSTATIDSISYDGISFIDLLYLPSSNLIAITEKAQQVKELSHINELNRSITVLKELETTERPKLFFDNTKSKLVFVYSPDLISTGRNFNYRYYNILNSSIQFTQEKTTSYFPIAFSETMDSVIVRNDEQYKLDIIDLNTNSLVFQDEYTMYNSNFFQYTNFLSNGLFYVQDQYNSFLIDTKLIKDRVVERFDYCCDHSANGSIWNKKDNTFIDFRRSNTSGVSSFFSVYKISPGWNIIVEP
jgi:hypothetical protein